MYCTICIVECIVLYVLYSTVMNYKYCLALYCTLCIIQGILLYVLYNTVLYYLVIIAGGGETEDWDPDAKEDFG